MKVLLVNGSPRSGGCTYTALREVETTLNSQGIDTEIFQIGNKPIRGCVACRVCKTNPNKCVFNDDPVNAFIEKCANSDGVIIGTPVYYAGANGALTALLDRAFYAGGGLFKNKPGAAIASARRGGTTAALDRLNKYFTISCMPIVSSQYWNMVHGNTPEEVIQDLEGMQTLRLLAKNTAWMLKCIEAGKEKGIEPPETEERQMTNFIR